MTPATITTARADHFGELVASCPASAHEVARYAPARQRDTGLAYDRPTRPRLAEGFVNFKRAHESGVPWYVPAGRVGDRRDRRLDPGRPALVVRVPCIVTCPCGVDVGYPTALAAQVAAIEAVREEGVAGDSPL